MADPKRKFDLTVVDENYAGTDPAQAHQAAGIREGVKRERARMAPTMAAAAESAAKLLKQAHTTELDRLTRTVGKAEHRSGVLHGLVMGMALAIAVAFGTWIILREVVITNTAGARVALPNDGVPELIDRERPTQYERVNPREPGNAP